MRAKDDGTRIGDERTHREHVIRCTLHGFEVVKDGKHVCWALSFEDGEQRIDAIPKTKGKRK